MNLAQLEMGQNSHQRLPKEALSMQIRKVRQIIKWLGEPSGQTLSHQWVKGYPPHLVRAFAALPCSALQS